MTFTWQKPTGMVPGISKATSSSGLTLMPSERRKGNNGLNSVCCVAL